MTPSATPMPASGPATVRRRTPRTGSAILWLQGLAVYEARYGRGSYENTAALTRRDHHGGHPRRAGGIAGTHHGDRDAARRD